LQHIFFGGCFPTVFGPFFPCASLDFGFFFFDLGLGFDPSRWMRNLQKNFFLFIAPPGIPPSLIMPFQEAAWRPGLPPENPGFLPVKIEPLILFFSTFLLICLSTLAVKLKGPCLSCVAATASPPATSRQDWDGRPERADPFPEILSNPFS